jgi:uncharacterized membrane protein YeaQ/YmgE (transglycosylase-associated protein family)
MDHLLWTILIGFVVGVLAKFFYPGSGPQGFVITTVLGIVGAFVAQFIGQALGMYTAGESSGLVASVLGAMLVLAAYHFARRD